MPCMKPGLIGGRGAHVPVLLGSYINLHTSDTEYTGEPFQPLNRSLQVLQHLSRHCAQSDKSLIVCI